MSVEITRSRREVSQIIDAAMRDVEGNWPVVTIISNAHLIDAVSDMTNAWIVCDAGVIVARGQGDDSLREFIERNYPGDMNDTHDAHGAHVRVVDADGAVLVPGYIDIHAHGAWSAAFDDGAEAISVARAYHMLHGTTRQILSLITNPWDQLLDNVRQASAVVRERCDTVGLHLEGPFLSPAHKGAHDLECLLDPTDDKVSELLDAAEGTLRQITLAPELPHGLSSVPQWLEAGVMPALGHCDADYDMAVRTFESGSHLMTHMFNAMNGISHRAPGPIAAASENDDVICELIADGFHVHVPALRIATELVPGRIALVTDSMAATGCDDGRYMLGNLEVDVENGHARLVSNGAIAGSTLSMEEAVQRMVHEVGLSVQEAVKYATYNPARALSFDSARDGRPALGLLDEQYSADFLLLDEQTLAVQKVWCAGVAIHDIVS